MVSIIAANRTAKNLVIITFEGQTAVLPGMLLEPVGIDQESKILDRMSQTEDEDKTETPPNPTCRQQLRTKPPTDVRVFWIGV
jgi:hypothetical protein